MGGHPDEDAYWSGGLSGADIRDFSTAGGPEASTGAGAVSANGEADERSGRFWLSSGGSHNVLRNTDGVGRASFYGPELAMGYEKLFANDWFLGAAAGYGFKKMRIDGRDSSADIHSYSASLYGGKRIPTEYGDWRLSAGGVYTRHQLDANRRVALDSGEEDLSADYGINSWQALSELSFIMAMNGKVFLEPYAAISYYYTDLESFRERGGSAALRSGGANWDNADTRLGMRLQAYPLENLRFSLEAGWRHTIGDERFGRDLIFADGSDGFHVLGSSLGRNEALIGAGLAWQALDNFSLRLEYQGALGRNGQSHGGFINGRFTW